MPDARGVGRSWTRALAGLLALSLSLAIGCRTTSTNTGDVPSGGDGAGNEAATESGTDGGMDVSMGDGGDMDAVDVTMGDGSTDARADVRTDARADVPADTAPACTCPALPTTCTAPVGNSATFAPGDDSMLRQLFGAIACADTTLHMALYETTWPCIVDAFLARLAAAPSLQVQIVIDNDQCPRVGGTLMCELSRLDGHPRVQIVDDMRSALMHDKFVIVDNEAVWIASANMSRRSYCQDANNAIVLTDMGAVAAYEAEFQRMFTMRMFGPRPDEAPVTSGPYTIYFTPRSPISSPNRAYMDLLAEIGRATTSIEFAMNAYTRDDVTDALLAARMRGVNVRGIVSSVYVMQAAVQRLIMGGVPVRVGDVHSKSVVIDGRLVITGSANWSTNAFESNENTLWIADRTVAGRYQTDFMMRFSSLMMP